MINDFFRKRREKKLIARLLSDLKGRIGSQTAVEAARFRGAFIFSTYTRDLTEVYEMLERTKTINRMYDSI